MTAAHLLQYFVLIVLGIIAFITFVVAGTILGCWGLTAVIRRVDWLRPLFGMKPRERHRSEVLASA